MNGIFSVAFVLIALFSIVSDIPKLAKRSRGEKWLYALFGIAAIGLFAAKTAGWEVPLPTSYFINTVGPWVSSFIHPS